eukprot:SAG11_NODE_17076_length_529_cov_1.055814_1_plen_58_part_10
MHTIVQDDIHNVVTGGICLLGIMFVTIIDPFRFPKGIPVYDVAWNPTDNMIAVCNFGQ